MIEQVFVMAAGRGERMRPITDTIPKPLVKINNKTMLDRVLDKLLLVSSIKKIVVNAYYLVDLIEGHLKLIANPKIILSKETEKLETAGGLIQALPLFDKTKPILIINSDIIWQDKDNQALELLIDNFDDQKMDILLGLKSKEQFHGYNGQGDFNFNPQNGDLIKNTGDDLKYVYVGTQIFHPRIINNCPKPPLSLNYFYEKALGDDGILKGVKGIVLPGTFFHVGTATAIKETETKLSGYDQ